MKRKSILLIVLFLILTGASFITMKAVIKPIVVENEQLKIENEQLVEYNRQLLTRNYELIIDLTEFRAQKESEKISQMSWMPYNIFSHSSKQYMLQLKATTDKNGLRKIGEYYCVALGSYYTHTVGEKFITTMSTGERIKLIVADQKSDLHTDSNGRFTKSDGSEIEFIVDCSKLDRTVRIMGNVAMLEKFRGDIVKIVKEN